MFLVVAAGYDLMTRRIPNWLTAPGIVAGIGINWYFGNVSQSLMGFGAAFGIYFLLFALRARGGGDVKLMAAVGAFVGLQLWWPIFIVTSILGGVVVLLSLACNGGLAKAMENVNKILGSLGRFKAPHSEHPELDVAHPQAKTMPHGAVIAIATIGYLLWVAR